MVQNTKRTVLSSLQTTIPEIFMDAQRANALQRSHAINLRKIQEACCLNSQKKNPPDIDYEGEKLFMQEMLRNINKILPIKKKEPHAERLVRFIAGFLLYIQEKDGNAQSNEEGAETQEPKEEGAEEEEEYETISSRFVEKLLRHLLRGFAAKRVPVRARCCQIVALSISSMGEIDEDLYQDLRASLFERIRDVDATVRIQAATALCRLQSADTDVDEADGKTILEKLIFALRYDNSAELRRVILFNIDPNEQTLPYIIERVRDVDAVNRRVVFLKPLSDIPDFRMIPLEDRNKLLKWGLNDREKLVRAATGKMLSTHWIRHANNNLIEFLERLEIMKSEVAEDVLNAFFSERLDIINEINFDAEFWKNLTPESAFLSKVFIKFLKNNNHEERLDSILPVVTEHAFSLENYHNLWRVSSKEAVGDYEFITTQMLEIALYLDYGDEVGRRKIFELLREILKASEVPDEHLKTIVRLFRIISLDERDFTRTMVEIISDIQEQADPLGTGAGAADPLELETPAKRARADADGNSFTSTENQSSAQDDEDREESLQYKSMIVKLRCLSICKNMLENSQETLQENTTMYGLLNDLIVPSVQSSEVLLREEGLHCLGLCCCLDKTLAEHNVTLFIHCIKNGHEGLQLKALKTLCDLMMTYGLPAITSEITNQNEIRELFEFCLDHDSQEIQAIAAEGLAKLMLARRFRDDEILRLMVLLYFFPTSGEGSLSTQQCLSYFFPAYCYSSPENQKSLINVAVSALEELCNIHEDLEENEQMVAPLQISDILADWTDPRKIAKQHISHLDDQSIDLGVQESIAIDALKIIFKETGSKRKVMSHFIQRLYLDEASEDALGKILILANHINSEAPIKDTLTRNFFNKWMKNMEELSKKKQGISRETSVEKDQAGNNNSNDKDNDSQLGDTASQLDNASQIGDSQVDNASQIGDSQVDNASQLGEAQLDDDDDQILDSQLGEPSMQVESLEEEQNEEDEVEEKAVKKVEKDTEEEEDEKEEEEEEEEEEVVVTVSHKKKTTPKGKETKTTTKETKKTKASSSKTAASKSKSKPETKKSTAKAKKETKSRAKGKSRAKVESSTEDEDNSDEEQEVEKVEKKGKKAVVTETKPPVKRKRRSTRPRAVVVIPREDTSSTSEDQQDDDDDDAYSDSD